MPSPPDWRALPLQQPQAGPTSAEEWRRAGAAYRVSTSLARVGFATDIATFGVLTRPVHVVHLKFTTSNCTGQAYVMGSLPADYHPYSRYFVVPAITQDGVEVTPARVMLLTTRET